MPPEVSLQLSVRRIRDSKLGGVVLLHLQQESKHFLVRETMERSSQASESGSASEDKKKRWGELRGDGRGGRNESE